MLKRLFARWVILAIAVGLTAGLLKGVSIHGGLFALLWISALFALVNLILGTFVRVITAPLMLLTLGLFGLVVNGLMFKVTSWLSDSLTVDGFGTVLLAGLIITVVAAVLALTPLGRPARKHKEHEAR